MTRAPRILIVEDERLIAEDTAEVLTNAGYRVTAVATTGPDAIEKAGRIAPDLVFMDILLEGEMSGVEAAGMILKQQSARVIFLTACEGSDVFKAQETMPVCEFLAKPFSEYELLRVVEQALNENPSEAESGKSATEFSKQSN